MVTAKAGSILKKSALLVSEHIRIGSKGDIRTSINQDHRRRPKVSIISQWSGSCLQYVLIIAIWLFIRNAMAIPTWDRAPPAMYDLSSTRNAFVKVQNNSQMERFQI